MTDINQYSNELEELKERLHIVDDESDKNLYRLMMSSYEAIQSICGNFPLNDNIRGKELVFERVRYAYNDILEHFVNNFLIEINNLAIDLTVYKGGSYHEG